MHLSHTHKLLVAAAQVALGIAGLGGSAQAVTPWLVTEEARVLEEERCQAAASYMLWRATLPPQFGIRATQRSRASEFGLRCGLGSGWQLGLDVVHADLDMAGYLRGLRLDARHALSQSSHHALSLGWRAQAERLSDSPVSHGLRYASMALSLHGEWRLGESHRVLGELSRGLYRGGEEGPWQWSLGYGRKIGTSWEAMAEASGYRHRKPTYGLGLRWTPAANSDWSYSLLVSRPRVDQGVRNSGVKAQMQMRF